MSGKHELIKDVPLKIVNSKTSTSYNRGSFLGKGGFARCYELIDTINKEKFAVKVIAKCSMTKKYSLEKVNQEICIHKILDHPHIVKIFDSFEDIGNCYIILELCPNKSLMELHKRRRTVTEPEARYFTRQIVSACSFLHKQNIIHRDLKLGNLFLSKNMDIKIGDFGLATIVKNNETRNKTLCGTPNYIAPEMLNKIGHSFEVDIWAIGCILYTLLVGKPPFDAVTINDTYNKIKSNNYSVPSFVSSGAKCLIKDLLHPDPGRRPKIDEIIEYEFFIFGYIPRRLPTSCLTMTPKFCNTPVSNDGIFEENQDLAQSASRFTAGDVNNGNMYLNDLKAQLENLLNNVKTFSSLPTDEETDPVANPLYFITKWVDYSFKYGLGYELTDGSVGVIYNDSTKFVIDGPGEQIQYFGRGNAEYYYTLKNYPASLDRKVTLLKYFRQYMQEHLDNAVSIASKEGDEFARLPVLKTWFRTNSAIILYLSNGTLQLNFFQDHIKLILCPLMSAVSYIDTSKNLRTYKFDQLVKIGCEEHLLKKLEYAKKVVDKMLNS
uniref:Serine/threonine-protein kinase PLK n=1 Tax=Parastrongyloides trichosuri TaxID=131310 RepID=A0A0N5A7B3_PARTI